MNSEQYLKSHWHKRVKHRKSTPQHKIQALLEEVFPNKNAKLVDVGCAHNVYKSLYPNLIGIDFVDFPEVDIVTSIQEAPFNTNSFEGAICLGLFHGEYDYVKNNLKTVIDWVVPNGFIIMRCRAEKPEYKDEVEFVHWDDSLIAHFENIFNLRKLDNYFKVSKNNGRTSNVWVWEKN